MSRELFWFGVVGVSAMLLHFGAVAWVLVPLGIAPLLANVLGFLIAFQLSYWGHRLQTFRAAHIPHRQALPRFFGVACLSFSSTRRCTRCCCASRRWITAPPCCWCWWRWRC